MPSARTSPIAIGKYVQRGWRVYFLPTPYEIAHPRNPPFFLHQVRWVSDNHTWVLPLDQTGVKERPPLSPASAPLTFDPVLLNGWTLRFHRGWELNGYECHSYPLQTTLFRYNYAIPDEALLFEMRHWVHQQGKYSHGQVSKKDWVWCVSFLHDPCSRFRRAIGSMRTFRTSCRGNKIVSRWFPSVVE